MRRLEKERWGKEFLYLDREQDRVYRNVAGGLAWPTAAKSGWLVVVAEESRLEIMTNDRLLWVLAEQEAEQVAEIYRYYRELSERFMVRDWYGNPKNKAMIHLFRQQPREVQGEKQLPLVVLAAPYHDHPQGLLFYVQTVNEQVQRSQKLLFFGENSNLPAYFQNLAPEQIQGPAEEYPAIAALGAAVTALRLYGPAPVTLPEYRERESWSPYGKN